MREFSKLKYCGVKIYEFKKGIELEFICMMKLMKIKKVYCSKQFLQNVLVLETTNTF